MSQCQARIRISFAEAATIRPSLISCQPPGEVEDGFGRQRHFAVRPARRRRQTLAARREYRGFVGVDGLHQFPLTSPGTDFRQDQQLLPSPRVRGRGEEVGRFLPDQHQRNIKFCRIQQIEQARARPQVISQRLSKRTSGNGGSLARHFQVDRGQAQQREGRQTT